MTRSSALMFQAHGQAIPRLGHPDGMRLGAHHRLVAPAWFACFHNCGVVFSPKREETQG
jgi:hypothetical protein